MAFEVRECNGYAVVVDHNGKSIADIVEQFDEGMGCKIQTPVFTPERAARLVALLNGDESVDMTSP